MKTDKNGYLYFYDPSHPLSSVNGIVYFHRHIASLMCGRWINGNEHVHHIDGNKTNNEISNLVILTKSQHTSLHFLKRSKKKCEVCGMPTYNTKYCSSICSSVGRRKTERPSIDTLIETVSDIGYEATGRKFGVTGNCVRKWIKHQ